MGLIKFAAQLAPPVIAFHGSLDRARCYDGRDLPRMYMTSFLQELVDAGFHLAAAPVRGGWLEVDTASDLETYRRLARAGSLDAYCRLRAGVQAPV